MKLRISVFILAFVITLIILLVTVAFSIQASVEGIFDQIQAQLPTPIPPVVSTTPTPIPPLGPTTLTPGYIGPIDMVMDPPADQNLLSNGDLDEQDFGLVSNWAQTDVPLSRWHLVQDVPVVQETNVRWVDPVDLAYEGRGFGLRAVDTQDCDYFCSTEVIQILPAIAGHEYEVSAEARSPQGIARLYLDFLGAGRSRLQVNTAGGYNAEWSAQSIRATAPEGTTYVRIILYTDNASTGWVEWDNIQLVDHTRGDCASFSSYIVDDPAEGANPDLHRLVVSCNQGMLYITISFYPDRASQPDFVYLYAEYHDGLFLRGSTFGLMRDRKVDGLFEESLYTGQVERLSEDEIRLAVPLEYMPDWASKQVWVYSMSSKDRLPDDGALHLAGE
ncbi:MAG: hypothetical protein JW726_05235 [Anaerolineales bacterium]|nr:hypothetical protein [Anaerolineales bacterium]